MEQKHVVMFPFLAQGHIIPFVGLANLIEQRKGCTITLVSTPLNIINLKTLLPPTTSILLAPLPFSCSDHGLPPNSESTNALPFHRIIDLFNAAEMLQPSFERLLSDLIHHHGRENILVLADMFLGWTLETAEKLGVLHSVFVTTGAYSAAIFFSLWLHPPLLPESCDEVPLLDYPEVHINRSELELSLIPGDGTDPLTTFLRRQISLCFRSSGLLVNTVEEFEKVGLSLLRRSPGLPVWAVGPVRLPHGHSSVAENGIIKWLDSKPPASVVYVSFGSQHRILVSDMMELAMGLEASGKAFIWVLRTPVEFEATDDFRAEWLPKGFEVRMREKQQGLLVHQWAPQMEILSHASTGAFLSHCGWNSVMESMSQGVPIIGWPLIGDQVHNCKMLVKESLGVCVEVKNGRRGVESAIGLVMGETEKGREVRRIAGEMREVLKAAQNEDGEALMGSSYKALEDFFQAAFSMMRADPIPAIAEDTT